METPFSPDSFLSGPEGKVSLPPSPDEKDILSEIGMILYESLLKPRKPITGHVVVPSVGAKTSLAAALGRNEFCKSLTILALATNGGSVHVGGDNVASFNALSLPKGGTVPLTNVWLNDVYIDVTVAGEGISFLGEV